MKKSVAVLGLGKYGKSLSEQLYRMGADVLAVDRNMKIIEEFSDKCTSAVCANLENEDEVNALGLKNMDIVVEEANTVIVALLPVCVPEIKQTAQELTISFRHQGESLLPPRLSDWIETGDKLQIPETEGFQIAIGEFRTARYARGDDAECVMIHTVLFQELMCLQHTVPAPFPGGIHPVQVVGFFKTVHR